VTPPELFPYQVVGAKFLAERERACLFDVPGLGKTAQAIRAADAIGARRIIVVCPAAVRAVWHGELKKFAQLPRKILKAKSIHDLGVWLKGKADVMLLSYEMASKWADKIDDLYDVLIIDEAHYAKNSQSNRTRALFGTNCDGRKGLGAYATRTWLLTGTPMANDPVDLWPLMRFVGATSLGLTPFTARYFKSRQGTFSAKQTPRDEMIPELRMALDATSLRRTKEQVGLQIPPIHLTTTTVDGNTDEIKALLKEWPGLEQAILDAIEQGGLSFLDAQHIATLRRLVGEAKAPAYAKLIAEEMKNGRDKLVVFTWHTRAAEIITSYLAAEGLGTTLVDGKTKETDRMAHVKSFQEDPEHRVFVGNIRAAGTGLTLTAASDLDMFESSWAPADNAQAIMRVHRIGQGRKVNARFISLAGSIDEVVSETVAKKTAAIASIENYGE
jgi:SWI/SNF-related matrix-associated actin-dependent regulator 1 of chromatin subfamily A